MRYLLLPVLLGIAGPATSGALMVAGASQFVPCAITDDTINAKRCGNLLGKDWQDDAAEGHAEALFTLVTNLPRNPQVHGPARKAFWLCRMGGKEKKRFPVTLTVPKAMASFPGRQGTDTRELVSAVFLAERDEGCKEARYGHRALNAKDDDGWERVAQFTTIESKASTGASAEKAQIGTWRSYSISRKQTSDNGYVYRFDGQLDKGKLYLCQSDSGHNDDVAYISCEERSRLIAAVEAKSLTGIGTIEDAMREFKAGNKMVRRAAGLTRDVSESPAWMRCGDLGCCAMY